MSRFCSTANLEVTETQTTTVEVEIFYVYHRKEVTVQQECQKDNRLTVYPCPAPKFKPKTDAEILYKMFECGKIDESVICHMLVGKSSPQRLWLVHEYKSICGEDLIAVFKKNLSGDFLTLVVALLTPPSEYLASEIHHAIEGFGTDEKTLIEIICTATNYQIEYIKRSYEKLYCKNLEDDVCSDTSSSFRKLLVLLLQGNRSESQEVCVEDVKIDVSNLIASGICKESVSHKEDVIFEILACRSYAHLCAVFLLFLEIAQCPVQTVINQKFSGDVKDALLTIIHVIQNKASFFAERIKDAVAGWGTKDRQLIRIIVSRCEVDLKEIKIAYQTCYNTCLENDVADDTSGWYRKTLLCLVQDEQDNH